MLPSGNATAIYMPILHRTNIRYGRRKSWSTKGLRHSFFLALDISEWSLFRYLSRVAPRWGRTDKYGAGKVIIFAIILILTIAGTVANLAS